MAATQRNLQFQISLIEHDVNEDVPPIIQTISAKRSASEGLESPFIFYKYKTEWIYSLRMPVDSDVCPDIKAASLVVVTKTFNPEKFNALLQILFQQYSQTGDPTKVLEGVLSVTTTGNFSNSAGTFDVSSYKDNDAYLAVSEMYNLSSMLGIEFITLWNAVLLKKRILVVADSVTKLLPVVRSLPQLTWHRKDFSILRPIITSDSEHLEDLNSSGVFIAGTLDDTIAARSDLYDVLLSLTDRCVIVSNHAFAEMKMFAIHREMSTIVNDASESGSNNDIIAGVAKKTALILQQLRSFIPASGKLTETIINENVSSTAAQQWLYRVATAEGLL